jgi:hypothetical protein
MLLKTEEEVAVEVIEGIMAEVEAVEAVEAPIMAMAAVGEVVDPVDLEIMEVVVIMAEIVAEAVLDIMVAVVADYREEAVDQSDVEPEVVMEGMVNMEGVVAAVVVDMKTVTAVAMDRAGDQWVIDIEMVVT